MDGATVPTEDDGSVALLLMAEDNGKRLACEVSNELGFELSEPVNINVECELKHGFTEIGKDICQVFLSFRQFTRQGCFAFQVCKTIFDPLGLTNALRATKHEYYYYS